METQSAVKKTKKRQRSPTFGPPITHGTPAPMSLKSKTQATNADDSDFSEGSDLSSDSQIDEAGLESFNVGADEIRPMRKQE